MSTATAEVTRLSERERAQPDLEQTIRAAEAARADVMGALGGRRTTLPLRYWRQQAHFTTPAADEAMARKAVEGGTAATARILERFGVSADQLAEHLGADAAVAERMLVTPARAPLVMLDGEDAQALRADVTAAGLRAAASVLVDADWSGGGPPTLRFYRPPGFNLDSTARDLYTVLWSLRERAPEVFPLDGIVFPKVEHPEEVDLLYDMLERAESALELPVGSIKVAFLIESGWAAAQLAHIAVRGIDRLCGLIFGLADYSADLGLPTIANDHPIADWVRAEIVNVAGATGVPAIDGMTLDYPVADPALDEAANRGRFLDRMKLVYDDAVRAREFGMLGKWVGHPAQLFATLLAFEKSFAPDVLEAEAAKLDAYRISVDEQARGATIIGGVMSDRATDRHARVVLRQAVALGRFDAQRAIAYGIVTPEELS